MLTNNQCHVGNTTWDIFNIECKASQTKAFSATTAQKSMVAVGGFDL